MAEYFNSVFADNPEKGKVERLSIKDVKPETDITVNEAIDFVKKRYFGDTPNASIEQGKNPETSDDLKNLENTSFENLEHRLSEEEKLQILEETGWSNEIIEHIESMEQYEIYKTACLHEEEINGRKCLVKDIDMDCVDPKSGKTNRQLMSEGKAPIDSKTKEKIELHHMGQSFYSPFAELCENTEHGNGNHAILHPSKKESWRRSPELKQLYQRQRADYWKTRSLEEK